MLTRKEEPETREPFRSANVTNKHLIFNPFVLFINTRKSTTASEVAQQLSGRVYLQDMQIVKEGVESCLGKK